MKLSRNQMLDDLKSIKKPFIVDVEFSLPCYNMRCKALTCTGGHYHVGYDGWNIGGPYRVTEEEYNEAKRISDLGYKTHFDYFNDSNIPEEELEQSEEISDDLSMAMFFVSRKLEFEKDYYIAWVMEYDSLLYFASKEEIESHLINMAIDIFSEEYIKWEYMSDSELKKWHSYLSNRKLEQWETWEVDDMRDIISEKFWFKGT